MRFAGRLLTRAAAEMTEQGKAQAGEAWSLSSFSPEV